MLWQPREELAERTLHGVSVAGSIAGVANRTKNAVRVMCSRVSTLLYERDRIIPVLKNRSPNMHSSTSLVSGQRLCVPSSTILMCFSYASVICNSVGRSSKQDKRNIVSIWQNSTITWMWQHCDRLSPRPKIQLARELTALQIHSLLLPPKVCSSWRSATFRISSDFGASRSWCRISRMSVYHSGMVDLGNSFDAS